MLTFERRARKKGYSLLIGIDEAGRGPLAGPLVVAACFLRQTDFQARVDDSKKLSPLQRQRAYDEIIDRSVHGVASVTAKQIDRMGLTRSLVAAVDRAISVLLRRLDLSVGQKKKAYLLLDGSLRSTLPFEQEVITGGDGKSLSIAAASVLAKVRRDRMMEEYDRIYPEYGFARHKGYGTAQHLRKIREFGLSDIHRRTFCHRGA